MPLAPLTRYSQAKLIPAYFPEDVRHVPFVIGANQVISKGTPLGFFTGATANEVQVLTPGGTVSGGSVTLGFGLAYATIQWNSTAAQVKALIEAAYLATYGIPTGGVTVTGGPLSTGALTITWVNVMAGQAQPLITVQNNLTGTSPTCTPSRTTTGVQNGALGIYNDALSNGLQVAKTLANSDMATDPAGNITYGPVATTGEHGAERLAAACPIRGYFRTVDLPGLDAAAVVDLGRLVSGTVADGVLAIY